MIKELKLDPDKASLQVRYEYVNTGSGQWVGEPTYDFICAIKDNGYQEGWTKAINQAKNISARADRRNAEVVMTIAGISTVVTSWQEIRDFLATTWVPKLVKAEPKEPVDPINARLMELACNHTKISNIDILGVIETLNDKINNLATHQTGSATPKGDN